MAFAMGGQNAVVHHAGKTRTSLTYVTGTLVNAGERLADALWSAGPAWAWAPYLVIWVGLACGGALGGIAHLAFGIRALLAPASSVMVLAAATGVKAWRDVRRERARP